MRQALELADEPQFDRAHHSSRSRMYVELAIGVLHVFTSGHSPHEWPAAVAYGLFMAFLWIARKDLITCITAHAVTNIALAVFVFATGKWQYW
jgi:hypothetical protein